MQLLETVLEKFNNIISIVKSALPFFNKEADTEGDAGAAADPAALMGDDSSDTDSPDGGPDVELPSDIESMMQAAMSGDSAAGGAGGESGDASMDDFEVELGAEGDVPLGENEDAEETPEKGKRKREKKEKPPREKKEKPVKEKKEKPVKEKKEKPAKEPPAEGEEGSESGGAKKIPALLWVILILLLIPGNLLFIFNIFFPAERNNNEDLFPQLVTPEPNNNNEQSPAEPVYDNTKFISTTFSEDDLFYVIGATRQELIEAFGHPKANSKDDVMIYGQVSEDRPALEITLFNNGTVDMIKLFSADYSMCGIRTVNSLSRISRAKRDLGAIELSPIHDIETEEIFNEFMFSYNDVAYSLVFVECPDGNWLRLSGNIPVDPNANTGSDSDINTGGDDGSGDSGDDTDDGNTDSSDSAGDSADGDSDGISSDETHIARLIGRRATDVTQMLGQPDKNERTDGGYTEWSYRGTGETYLIISIFNDRVFQISLLDDTHSLFRIECGMNLVDARAILMVSLGFIYFGSEEIEEVSQSSYKQLYNGIAVMITLVSAQDGTIAEIIFTDVDAAQRAGAE
ncbi:MAG: CAP-associated domain-containing protein [Oscillospiraceae bacterium]|nr:CAP-associated domain-containing protein [Oscillospiraceae bacterium]